MAAMRNASVKDYREQWHTVFSPRPPSQVGVAVTVTTLLKA